MARRSYAGGAQPTTLASSINSTTTVISAVALVGWPIPTHPFFAVLDRDTPNEEKVLCSSVNGNDITVIRGQDGTTARDHSAGAPFEHCHTATDADEANDHVNNTRAHGVPVGDDFVFRKAAQAIENETLDFGVAGGNVASNIPMAAVTGLDDAFAEALNDLNAYLPIGSIAMTAAAVAPAGWLICDGSAVARTGQYAALFNLIGTTYGPGDNTTTFNLPDLRGRFPVGQSADAEFLSVGQSGGAKTVTLTEQQIPSHDHSINHDHGAVDSGGVKDPSQATPSATVNASGGAGENNGASVAQGAATGRFTHPVSLSWAHEHSVDIPAFTGTSGAKGGGQPHTNLPPYLTINFMIRAVAAT